MFAIFEMLGLCGILGAKTIKEKHRVREMNRRTAKYDILLENEIRSYIRFHDTKLDGTPLDWNARNLVSYDYLTIQELRKRGLEPSPMFTIFNMKNFKFNEETGALIREPKKPL